MRIARLESFTTPEVGFVRLTTDGGETGWGQMSTYHADITAQVLHRQVAPWVLGRRIDGDDPVADFLDLAAFVHEREHKYPDPMSGGRWPGSIPRCGTCWDGSPESLSPR